MLQMSFLGNWCTKPVEPITPCARQFLGRGPMQDVTTQKHDFTWKERTSANQPVRPSGNFIFPAVPTERERYLFPSRSLNGTFEYKSFSWDNMNEINYPICDSVSPQMLRLTGHIVLSSIGHRRGQTSFKRTACL